MKEQLIKFETAKLAKEKGFDWKVYAYHSKDKQLNIMQTGNYSDPIPVINEFADCNYWIDRFSAPTQSLLQKWLRDEHKIFIELGLVDSLNDYWVRVDVSTLSSLETIWRNDPNNHLETYEQALEAGLIEALKLI